MTRDKSWWTHGDAQNIPISELIHWDDMDTPIYVQSQILTRVYITQIMDIQH